MDAAHPFDLPSDFSFSELGDAYASGDYTIDEVANAFGISRDTFLAIRKAAPHKWTKRASTNLWWSDLTESEGDLVERATAQAKAKRVDRKAKRKVKREEKRAAEQWWRAESAIEEAAAAFGEWRATYQPPKLQTPQSLDSLPDGAMVANTQDLHIGKRPYDSSDWTLEGYIDSIEDAFKEGLVRGTRNASLDRLYLVIGGDLVHVDSQKGTTTSGTPQDLACSPSEALERSIELMVRLVDLARQTAAEVRLVGLSGNHDKLLSTACFEAVRRHFRACEDVAVAGKGERIYDQYGSHLLAFTHGDVTKKQMRRIGDTITAEARELIGQTLYTTLYTGHLHFRASDVIDESGRLQVQASSPSPDDDWHHGEMYVGARKTLQMHILEPGTVTGATFALAAPATAGGE